MEINWTTFALEIVNFIVLVWLLAHFLYRPVLRVIDQRRQDIDQEMQNAQTLRKEADGLLAQCQGQLDAWEREKREQWDLLTREIEADRTRRTEELHKDLDEEQLRADAAAAHRRQELQRESEERALAQGGRFVARLLKGLAGPETEVRLAELFLAELERIPESQRTALRTHFSGEEERALQIVSAHPLDPSLRERLARTLQRQLGEELAVQFHEDPELIAGLEVSIGDWVLRANLRDELQFFSQGGPDAVTI